MQNGLNNIYNYLYDNPFVIETTENCLLNDILSLVNPDDDKEWEIALKHIIEKIWNDKEGKPLLCFVFKHKIKFYKSKRNTSYATKEVFIHKNHIGNSCKDKLYPIHVVIHEILHSIYRQDNGCKKDSFLEEMSVTMMGYQIASRIINHRELTIEEFDNYCKKSFINFTKSKSHNKLKASSEFLSYMDKVYDIKFPYQDKYDNPVSLYETLSSNPDIDYLLQFDIEIKMRSFQKWFKLIT